MSKVKPLPAGSTIGILGGGQLARMLASSAAKLGYRIVILDPDIAAPAAQVANRHIVAAYDDEAALGDLRRACDVVTYEFENVSLMAAHFVEDGGVLFPPSRALQVSQDRLVEKTALSEMGIAVAPFHPVEDVPSLRAALEDFGGGVLKTRRFGYDGKGQQVFSTAFDGSDAELDAHLSATGAGPWVLEKLIAFEREVSVICARGQGGEVVCFDPAENLHEGGILRRSTVPAVGVDVAPLSAMAVKIAEALNYVGVLSVEFFLTAEAALVNEIAPRVHNSGHWTVEACPVSQFEQHIRAITGNPLGITARHHDCTMENLLGDEIDQLGELLQEGGFVTHYGKMQPRPGRKMGHVTWISPRQAECC